MRGRSAFFEIHDLFLVRWHSPSQALTAKHVLYPQLTATLWANKTLCGAREVRSRTTWYTMGLPGALWANKTWCGARGVSRATAWYGTLSNETAIVILVWNCAVFRLELRVMVVWWEVQVETDCRAMRGWRWDCLSRSETCSQYDS